MTLVVHSQVDAYFGKDTQESKPQGTQSEGTKEPKSQTTHSDEDVKGDLIPAAWPAGNTRARKSGASQVLKASIS
jgi:hypothetical protein